MMVRRFGMRAVSWAVVLSLSVGLGAMGALAAGGEWPEGEPVAAVPNPGYDVDSGYSYSSENEINFDILDPGQELDESFSYTPEDDDDTASGDAPEPGAGTEEIFYVERPAGLLSPLTHGAVIRSETRSFYSYCINHHLAWPDIGTAYRAGDESMLTSEQRGIIVRVLNGGYPLDLYGFSDLAVMPEGIPLDEDGYSDFMSEATQQVMWAALGQLPQAGVDNLTVFGAYGDALYTYATTGQLPDGCDENAVPSAAVVTAPEKMELRYEEETNRYHAEIALEANKQIGVSVDVIPAGMKVFYGDEEVKVGDQISSYAKLSLSVDGAMEELPEEKLQFSYISYVRVKENSAWLLIPMDEYTGGSNYEGYQNMAGYEFEEVDPPIVVTLALVGQPGETPAPIPTATPTPTSAVTPDRPDHTPDVTPTPTAVPTPEPVPTAPTPPDVALPDEDVPLGDAPEQEEDTPAAAPDEEFTIVDAEVPMGNLPQTGTRDAKTVAGAAAVLLASGAALGAAGYLSLRKKSEQ